MSFSFIKEVANMTLPSIDIAYSDVVKGDPSSYGRGG
jgi:hypothetical protein